MVESEITFRSATFDDAADMAEVDRQSWPAALAVTAEQFARRIDAYADGQLVAEADGRIVGTSSSQRIRGDFLEANDHLYSLMTDRNRFTDSHDPAGEVFQLIGVGVLPEFRGRGLGRRLVDRQIAFARSLPGIRRIIGFTRPADFHESRETTIEEYVRAQGEDGRLLDEVLAFHVDAGARIVSIYVGFRPKDVQAGGYGVLIEYL